MSDILNLGEIQSLAARAKAAKLTQETIAIAIGASQSQVSRILAGKSKRTSKLHNEICAYVDSRTRTISPELVRSNEELVLALAGVWNGTAQQSATLAAIIRSLGGLCPPVQDSENHASASRKKK
jgi:transcriptional regulator with XRE-family HTH domain